MIEYCQVMYNDGNVIALDGSDRIIATGKELLRVFNDLGRDGWKMCGIKQIDFLPGERLTDPVLVSDIVYFMRETFEKRVVKWNGARGWSSEGK